MTEGVFHRDVLDGGLTVVSEEVPGVRSVSIGVWVRSGSRDEKQEQGGLSHFIEHMVFKGTRERNAFEIARSLESVGGSLDAFATRESTCYYARVLDEHLPLAVTVLADIVCHSLFDGDEIEKEQRVVLDEIRQFEDTPDDQIHDLFSSAIWKGHPLGRSVLGTKETVSSFKRKDVLDFFALNYGAPNVVISVAGRFDHSELVRLLNASFSLPENARPSGDDVIPAYERQTDIHGRELSQEYLCVGTRGIAQSHELRFPLLLLNASVGGGMSSRLFQKVREKEGLAYAVYSYADFVRDSGLFCAFMGVAPDSTERALTVVLDEFAEITRSGLSPEEIRSAKAQLKGALFLGLESMSNRMTRLAKSEIYWGRYVSLDEVVSLIEEVNEETVSQAAGLVLDGQNLSVVAMGPCPESQVIGPLQSLSS
jgi:predicted Zn-dependent peptidase